MDFNILNLLSRLFQQEKKIEELPMVQASKQGIYDVTLFGATGLGVGSDSDAINRAVEAANKHTDVGTKGNARGARVFFPPGVYNIDKPINLKSGIVYEGAGIYATRFNPIGTSGYVFERNDNDDPTVRLGVVQFRDFTISPTDSHFAYTDKYKIPPQMGGINPSYSSSIYLDNVNILNIDGIGLNLVECYDSYFSNSEFIYVGKDTSTPAIAMYSGLNDLTNAIHSTGLRIENCPAGLIIDGKTHYNKMLRELQFIGCKFENAPVIIHHAWGVTFSACNFTPHGEGTEPYIVVGADDSDTRGLNFNSCSFISGTSNKRWIFDIRGTVYGLKIESPSVTGIKTFLTSKNQKIRITNMNAVTCGTPFIRAETGNLRVTGGYFFNMLGDDYVIAGGANSKILDCDFERVGKGISLSSNSFAEMNNFNNITSHAFYISEGGNSLQKNRYEAGVVKEIEYLTPTISLVTFRSDQYTSSAPAGYNEQPRPQMGINGQFGTPMSVTGNGYRYFTNPRLKVVVGGSFGSGETVTIKIQANYDDGTSKSIEKTYSALTTEWLTEDEISTLVSSRLQLKSFTLFAKSTKTTASTAGISVKVVANVH